MKEVFGDSDDEGAGGVGGGSDDVRRKRAARRRKRNCIDTIIDGSFMGMVLAVCLAMVLGSALFAYKNLYYAVLKKIYPESVDAEQEFGPLPGAGGGPPR